MKVKISPFKGLKILQTTDDIEKIEYQLDSNINHWLICEECGNTSMSVKVVIVADATLDLTNELCDMKEYKINIVNVNCCGLCESKDLRKIGDMPTVNDDLKTTRLVPRHTGD